MFLICIIFLLISGLSSGLSYYRRGPGDKVLDFLNMISFIGSVIFFFYLLLIYIQLNF